MAWHAKKASHTSCFLGVWACTVTVGWRDRSLSQPFEQQFGAALQGLGKGNEGLRGCPVPIILPQTPWIGPWKSRREFLGNLCSLLFVDFISLLFSLGSDLVSIDGNLPA